MNAAADWFRVDREGLAKLLERRGPEFILYELVSNAFDQDVTRVDVTIEPVPNKHLVRISVEDDDPLGFSDLAHSFTLFAESAKKSAAEKRGRFNLGEKLVLAMCERATITTTSGTVEFDETGRSRRRFSRERGSEFVGLLKISREAMKNMIDAASKIIVPSLVQLTVNGVDIQSHDELGSGFEVTLDTEVSDEEGVLRRRSRQTRAHLYGTLPGETGWLYELGIPVVETGDRYHVSVDQKIPLTMERDNVTPAYLRAVRAAVLNYAHEFLTPETATASWVREALSSKDVTPEAVRSAVQNRFGNKIVSYDPSDPEANNLAVVKGYTVVHGGQMSKQEWQNVRDAGAILPAGQVTPSPKPFHPDGTPLEVIDPADWTPTMVKIADYAERLALRTIRKGIDVTFTKDPGWKYAAAFGPDGELTIHTRSFRDEDAPANLKSRVASERLDALLIHEFAHYIAGNHLSEKFYDECCRIGAAAKAWVSEGAEKKS